MGTKSTKGTNISLSYLFVLRLVRLVHFVLHVLLSFVVALPGVVLHLRPSLFPQRLYY